MSHDQICRRDGGGEGLVGIPEVGVAVVECFSRVSTTVNMLIEFQRSFPLIYFVKIPSYSKCGLRICGLHKVQ